MKKIMTKAAIYLTLSTTCFAGENIEPDIEMGSTTASSIHLQLTLEDEKQKEQIPQKLLIVIPDDKKQNVNTHHENNENTNSNQAEREEPFSIFKYTRGLILEYGIQTASGLTVLGVWYKYFS